MTRIRLVVPLACLALVLAGCAQPQPQITDDPVVSNPSDGAEAPDPKPTSAVPDSIGPLCFEDFGFSADQEQHGGTVTWPEPITDDVLGVEPSCWVDGLASDRNLFIAAWYGLDSEQYDAVNGPVEASLLAAGYQLTADANGISGYELDPGDGQPVSVFQITRSDGYLELTAQFTGRA